MGTTMSAGETAGDRLRWRRTGRYGIVHVPALDGLRGVAIIAVLLYHAGHLRGGYLGVDLFFVLSGFLITSLLLAEHRATGEIRLRSFWGRRARRLLPAILVLLAGVALYARFLAREVELGGIRADALAALGYVANWRTILHGTNYWDISLAPSPLQHMWSLAIEEQFYVVWPIVFLVAVRHRVDAGRAVLRVALIGAGASTVLFLGLHALGMSDNRVYEGTDTRAVSLLLGCALAAWRARSAEPVDGSTSSWLLRWADDQRPLVVELAGLFAAVGLGLLWFHLDGGSAWLYRGGLPLASLLAAVSIGAATRPRSPVLGRLLSIPQLRVVGALSYALYLWHWPIYVALDTHNGRFFGHHFLHDPYLLILKLVLSFLAAFLSTAYLELPIRRGAVRRPFAIPLTAGAIAVTVAVLLNATAAQISPSAPLHVAKPKVRVEQAPTLVFAGDSVAVSLVSRVTADPLRYGVNPVVRATKGCSVIATGRQARDFAGRPFSPPKCQETALRDLKRVRPDAVLLVVGARPNDAVRIDGKFVRACDPGWDAAYLSSTVDLVRKLRATGAPVVLGTVLHTGEKAIPVEGSERRIRCVNQLIRRAAQRVPGTKVVDANELVCPTGKACRETLDGAPIRSDGVHFDAGPGGARVADWMVAETLKAVHLKPVRVALPAAAGKPVGHPTGSG